VCDPIIAPTGGVYHYECFRQHTGEQLLARAEHRAKVRAERAARAKVQFAKSPIPEPEIAS
jgi:hypothetical protein